MPQLARDSGWLAGFRAGEREALGRVYDEYADELARGLRMGFRLQTTEGLVVVSPVTSTFEIESLVHEVFLRAFAPAARQAYDGQRPFLTWLLRIGRNLRIDQHRRDRGLVFVDQPPEVEASDEPENRLIDQELHALVRAFVAALGEPDHTYYDARYRGGGSQTEAAAACGLTRIQGRRIEARIKHDLVVYLEAHGHGSVSKEAEDEL